MTATITSELDYDERTMCKVYGGLWRIEQSFRIMKTDLYARPVFVSRTSISARIFSSVLSRPYYPNNTAPYGWEGALPNGLEGHQ